jgi:hypothetical protein
VLQSQRDAVIVLDETGTVRQFNAQAVRYFPNMQRGILLPELSHGGALAHQQPFARCRYLSSAMCVAGNWPVAWCPFWPAICAAW